jgi:hypothetical protein
MDVTVHMSAFMSVPDLVHIPHLMTFATLLYHKFQNIIPRYCPHFRPSGIPAFPRGRRAAS